MLQGTISRLFPWAAGHAVLLALVVTLLMRRDPRLPGLYPPCPFNYLSAGSYCAGCGSLRSLHALLEGNVRQALAYNALVVIALLPLSVMALQESVRRVTGRPVIAVRTRPWFGWLILIAVTSFWLARNIPFVPFNCLAPHAL